MKHMNGSMDTLGVKEDIEDDTLGVKEDIEDDRVCHVFLHVFVVFGGGGGGSSGTKDTTSFPLPTLASYSNTPSVPVDVRSLGNEGSGNEGSGEVCNRQSNKQIDV
jgi:hypothetical protein